MNMLNSVLLEGVLIEDPIIISSSKNNEIVGSSFTIKSIRFIQTENNYEEEISYFSIKWYGKIAKLCNKFLKKDRSIRVIGRLVQIPETFYMYVLAEHIEFKPQ